MRLEDSNVRSFMKVVPVSKSQDAYILHLKQNLAPFKSEDSSC